MPIDLFDYLGQGRPSHGTNKIVHVVYTREVRVTSIMRTIDTLFSAIINYSLSLLLLLCIDYNHHLMLNSFKCWIEQRPKNILVVWWIWHNISAFQTTYICYENDLFMLNRSLRSIKTKMRPFVSVPILSSALPQRVDRTDEFIEFAREYSPDCCDNWKEMKSKTRKRPRKKIAKGNKVNKYRWEREKVSQTGSGRRWIRKKYNSSVMKIIMDIATLLLYNWGRGQPFPERSSPLSDLNGEVSDYFEENDRAELRQEE